MRLATLRLIKGKRRYLAPMPWSAGSHEATQHRDSGLARERAEEIAGRFLFAIFTRTHVGVRRRLVASRLSSRGSHPDQQGRKRAIVVNRETWG